MTKELILISDYSTDPGQKNIDEYVAKQAHGEVGVITFGLKDPEATLKKLEAVYSTCGTKVRMIKELDDLYDLYLVLFPDIDDVDACLAEMAAQEMDILLRPQWKKGNVILAGQGVGARMLGWDMLESTDGIEIRKGHGPMGSVLIVPNWDTIAEEVRQSLAEEYKLYTIFALDTDTAVVWRNGHMEVLGTGSVELLGRTQGKWSAGETFTIMA